MKHLLVVCLLAIAWPALAQNLTFDGCTDARGNPVTGIADEKLPAVAQYGVVEGKPAIRYNPQALPRLLLETRLFVYAHECGRQYLGFPAEGERTAAQARQADCWAYATLKRSVLSSPQVLAAVEDDLSMAGWGELPGPARELKLASCTAIETKASEGSLKLPSGPARDKWNQCEQACGAKLYSCGRAASCEAVFSQCSAACGK
ncbi:MAG: putative secreted protein [Rhodocyclales bacterium]|nr:putative secreted protein [Rhodocyclales bacterium]